ncbi:phage tail protein [Providencia stuartii]|uniref:phage tail protein n=1 Tax=Providencia stuartii TaxID=588 RepID=UPI0023E0E386|nr:phage tail protein [Providencia stuartii]WER24121.1 phage tail protein [Providencia stuartii]WER28240.1 phage tail protein [Providencia stuartii]WER32331.1 phage tail protein [Providencia stuartii]
MTLQIQGNTTNLLAYRQRNDTSWSRWFEIYSTANTTKDRNGNLKVSGSSDALSDYPVGAPIPWPQSTAPTGYLICNGQTFNKTTYPLLASAYPSGKLPDLRGEFIRGLDAGRGIDVNRTVLSSQRCATEHHKHISGWGEASNVNATFGKTVKSGYAGSGDSDHDNYLFYTNDGSEFQGSNPNPTGIMANETRPRNIAFLYIVRAA